MFTAGFCFNTLTWKFTCLTSLLPRLTTIKKWGTHSWFSCMRVMIFRMKMIFFSFHCRVIREQRKLIWRRWNLDTQKNTSFNKIPCVNFSIERKKQSKTKKHILFTVFQIPDFHTEQFRYEAKLRKGNTPVTRVVVGPKSSLHIYLSIMQVKQQIL